jgi:hypothetical protein
MNGIKPNTGSGGNHWNRCSIEQEITEETEILIRGFEPLFLSFAPVPLSLPIPGFLVSS